MYAKLSRPCNVKSLVVSRRAAMLMVSRQCLVRKRAVSAALRVGQAAQAIGAAVDVQFDGQLHPNRNQFSGCV